MTLRTAESPVEPLLFLCHRLPYPPNKGDKIRSYHILRHLSERFHVHLGTFVDDPDDERFVATVAEWCADLKAIRIVAARRRMASAEGFLSGRALSVAYYANREMSRWVADTMERCKPTRILVFSSTMAQFVLDRSFAAARRVVDFVDVDSAKWRAYARARPWPMSAVYDREARRLWSFERQVAAAFDSSVFVSRDEAALFNALLPAPLPTVTHVNNGVDVGYFTPSAGRISPYPAGVPVLVFTGAMDYWANVDAVHWFVAQVWPAVRAGTPLAQFWIVGSRPTRTVRRLARQPGVVVTGKVDDVRPYLQHAAAAVAPMRIARGVQNKVLEAMAMARPVIGTAAAFEGLEIGGVGSACCVDAADEMARRCISSLRSEAAAGRGVEARAYVAREHDWTTNMQKLTRLLDCAA